MDFESFAILGLISLPILAIVVLGIRRLIHARLVVRRTLEQNGFRIQELQRRIIRCGPFQLGVRDDIVFRASATDSAGRPGIVWARWSRPWFWQADRLEVRWE